MSKYSDLVEIVTATIADSWAIAIGTTGQKKKTLNNALVNIINKDPIQLLSQEQNVDETNRDTASTSYVAVAGNSVTVDPVTAGSKIRIQVTGIGGQSTSSLTHITLYRNIDGAGDVDITPAGNDCFAAVRLGDEFQIEDLSIDFLDDHGAADGVDVVYTLYWKTSVGTAYLGRRGSSTAFDAPTVMTAQEYL